MAILLTGLTGEVGSVLAPILQLKEKVFCLVRDGKTRAENGKLEKIPLAQIVDGDIFDEKLCGISIAEVDFLKKQGIAKIVHGAASVKFDEELSDEIWKTNFNGTKNILSLAKELNVKEFHYLSTAYAPIKRNPYEKSKFAAEGLVKESGIAHSIYRLGIVIGDSNTGYTKGFNGYYGFFVGPYRLAERIREKRNCNGVVELPIYIDCSFESTANLVPVNWATEILSKLIELPCQNKTFNITHPNPPKVDWVMKEGFRTMGIRAIRYNDYKKPQPKQPNRYLRTIQKAANAVLKRYRPYVTEEPRFSLQTTRECLDGNYEDPPQITSKLLAMLLEFAIEKNFTDSKNNIALK